MSNLNGDATNFTNEIDEIKSPLHSETSLHRDGEQARIIEVVRRRQQVLHQRYIMSRGRLSD